MLKTMKKYIPKRKYRERSQLERRKNFGLLEKKQDYKKRAEDYHRKEANYKKLKEKARTRNPDEFYFKMTNAKTIVTNIYDKGRRALPT
jgi:U3 small nucleolar RNA-associated protein 11